MCGSGDSVCEVDRVPTQMDDMCIMLKDMGRVELGKLQKEIEADKAAVVGSVTVVADRAMTQKEIQRDYNTITAKNASVTKE